MSAALSRRLMHTSSAPPLRAWGLILVLRRKGATGNGKAESALAAFATALERRDYAPVGPVAVPHGVVAVGVNIHAGDDALHRGADYILSQLERMRQITIGVQLGGRAMGANC